MMRYIIVKALYCTPETNITLYINFISIFKNHFKIINNSTKNSMPSLSPRLPPTLSSEYRWLCLQVQLQKNKFLHFSL